MTPDDLERWFTYHPPRPGQNDRYMMIRQAARYFAQTILENTPEGPDQTAAIRKVREAVMTANVSIACETEGESRMLSRDLDEAATQAAGATYRAGDGGRGGDGAGGGGGGAGGSINFIPAERAQVKKD